MAVKITTKSDATSVGSLLTKFQKDKGKEIGSFGGHYMAAERIPTGLFPFDLATGGGIPRGVCTIIYGPESSNKTNMALLAIAANQVLRPHEVNVYVAIEPFDKQWAARMGVDVDKLVVVYPSYAEEAVDMVETFLYADDCGVVVVDSLAAMITTAEAEKSAEGANPGGQGLVVGKLVRKTTLALREQFKRNRQPTLIYINQTRFKIGVMFGNPETMPGGEAPKFQAALWVRVHGKNVKNSKVSEDMYVLKEVSFLIKKNKVPIHSTNGMYSMATAPHENLRVGDTDDVNTVLAYAKELGLIEEQKKGFTIMDVTFPTQKAFKDYMRSDLTYARNLKSFIIMSVMQKADGIIQAEPVIDADGVIVEPEVPKEGEE